MYKEEKSDIRTHRDCFINAWRKQRLTPISDQFTWHLNTLTHHIMSVLYNHYTRRLIHMNLYDIKSKQTLT